MRSKLKMTLIAAMLSAGLLPAAGAFGHGFVAPELAARFEYLSTHGNSSCGDAFKRSIATMAPTARIQGSCCSPMDLYRYGDQVSGLEAYRHIAEIPPDPYDIEAGLARKLLANYRLELSATEQAAYDQAMELADEKGPCCCPCWRWETFGGLGKYLIRQHGFTGAQVAEVWDLSDGCGGGEDHKHS